MLEYAVGANPKVPDPRLSPFDVTRDNTEIHVQYWRAINTPDLAFTVQSSPDGIAWSDHGPGQSLGQLFSWEQFRLTVPLADATNRLFRLKVSTVP